MATGMVDNWLNIDTFGAIYPFVGTEGFLAFAGIVFWIVWHIWQIRDEKKEFDQDVEWIAKKGGPLKVLEEEGAREMEDAVGR